jgi:hypothetical protein
MKHELLENVIQFFSFFRDLERRVELEVYGVAVRL